MSNEIVELKKRLEALEKVNNPNIDSELKLSDEFDGVFRFSNNSDEPFTVLWNNKEYTFAPHTRSPMIISGESLENIQAIRKRWAYKWAEKEWYKSEQYLKMKEQGQGKPPIRQDKDLEPLIQMCLDPLPIVKAEVKDGEPEKIKLSEFTAAVGEDDDLNSTFKDITKPEKIRKLGKQSTTFSA